MNAMLFREFVEDTTHSYEVIHIDGQFNCDPLSWRDVVDPESAANLADLFVGQNDEPDIIFHIFDMPYDNSTLADDIEVVDLVLAEIMGIDWKY